MSVRPDGVAVVVFDAADNSVNAISSSFFAEFREVLDRIEADEAVRAAVLTSAKSDTFAAGADLDEVLRMESGEQAEAFVREAHRLLDRVARSRKPFVAAIHGAALGGGLEIALACHGRVATDHPKTVFGLPEVMVGLIPAGGGTQRLPRLIGVTRALPMMLTGNRIRARKALRTGIVDRIAGRKELTDYAATFALELAAGPLRRSIPFRDRVLASWPLRDFVLLRARKSVLAKTRGNYPAPLAIIDAVARGLRDGFAAGQETEIRNFGRLVVSEEGRNLLRLFRAMNDSKKPPVDALPRPVRAIGVLGAGLMGEGIAAVSLPVSRVVLRDISSDALHRAAGNIEKSLAKRESSGALTPADASSQRAALTTASDLAQIAGVDLVIEAVFEDLTLKRQVLAETEAVVSDDAVFASNTSALPIGDIARDARRPDRVVGMHYFSPVPKMPLLEVVAAAATAPDVVATAHATGVAQGKSVIVVNDGPGFYTTRILAPFMNEAIVLLEEGARIEALDAALMDFGFPVGPVTLLDEVGIDVAAHVAGHLGEVFAERGLGASPSLLAVAHAGYAGRKNRRGFFRYDESGRKRGANEEIYRLTGGRPRVRIAARDMVDRLVLLMVNEAVTCLADGVLRSPRDGDLGAILGIGFPPFRGGPFRWADAIGAGALVGRMDALERKHGRRFRPSALLRGLAERGEMFYAESDPGK